MNFRVKICFYFLSNVNIGPIIKLVFLEGSGFCVKRLTQNLAPYKKSLFLEESQYAQIPQIIMAYVYIDIKSKYKHLHPFLYFTWYCAYVDRKEVTIFFNKYIE